MYPRVGLLRHCLSMTEGVSVAEMSDKKEDKPKPDDQQGDDLEIADLRPDDYASDRLRGGLCGVAKRRNT